MTKRYNAALDICIADQDECLTFPCQNGGSCFDEISGYRCECIPYYAGPNCVMGWFSLHHSVPLKCGVFASCLEIQ